MADVGKIRCRCVALLLPLLVVVRVDLLTLAALLCCCSACSHVRSSSRSLCAAPWTVRAASQASGSDNRRHPGHAATESAASRLLCASSCGSARVGFCWSVFALSVVVEPRPLLVVVTTYVGCCSLSLTPNHSQSCRLSPSAPGSASGCPPASAASASSAAARHLSAASSSGSFSFGSAAYGQPELSADHAASWVSAASCSHGTAGSRSSGSQLLSSAVAAANVAPLHATFWHAQQQQHASSTCQRTR